MYFSLVATCAFDVISKNPLQIQGHEDLHTFSCKNFAVLAFTFRSLIHFELIFVHGVREVQIHSFQWKNPVVPAPFVEEKILSQLNGY